MRAVALALALALAVPAAAQDLLPPPPPPPGADLVPSPAGARAGGPRKPSGPGITGTIGEGQIAAAGSQAAPNHPDEAVSHWAFSMATGVAGKFGGMQLESDKENPGVLLYFGGQADGLWTEGYGQAVRLRLRLFTGGESEIYVPSDGDAEAAYMIGRREFRFVIGRVEVGRYPALALQTVAQVGTLPCFEGSLPLAGDTMRLYYFVSPVEAAWVRYLGDQHIDGNAGFASESGEPVAATAGRLRYTVLLPPSVLLSMQGDVMKMWKKTDLMVSAEGSLGYQVLDQSAVFNASVRWNSYRRRGPDAPNTSKTESEVLLMAMASLVF